MISSIKIENGEYGPRAVLTSPWQADFADYLREKGAAELELNDGKGWKGNDISFLKLFPNLRALTIIDLKMPSVAPIHYLHKLRNLEIITYCKTPIDFSAFPLLEDCGLEWRTGSGSLFDCVTLKRLFVNRYPKKGTSDFARLSKLESLILLNSPIENLAGIGALKHLRYLRLGNLNRLYALDDITGLRNLEELEIQKCRRITSIDAVSKLPELRKLLVNESGNLDSLRPVQGLNKLEWVLFYGSTNIVDGDLSPLLSLKNLKRVSFQNRKHYSHRREEFGTAFSR